MRTDAIGLFWEDLPAVKGQRAVNRIMPAIPDTGWKAPAFPRLSDAPYISIDVETKDPELLTHGPGWARGKGHLVGISVAVPGRAWYFPMRHEVCADQNLDPDHVLSWARDTLCNPSQPKLGANLLYDVGWLSEENVHVRGKLYDVQFAEALLDETARTNLDELGVKYLGTGKETNQLYQWSADYYGGSPDGRQRAQIYRCPPCLVGPYAEGDADLPQRIMPLQWELLEREGLANLFDMECRLIPLLIAMRRAGATVDTSRAEQVKAELERKVKELHVEMKSMVGFEVNVDANDNLQRCFRALGVQIPLSTKGKASFTKDTLERVEHPFSDLVLGTRKLKKVAGTFLQSYILDKAVNGRVFCQFHPLRGDSGGTRSGRFASSDPNLQNVPSRDEELAPLVRSCFVPDAGHLQWRRYDYSQIEYRGLAHFAVGKGSDELRAKYVRDPDTDYHVHTQNLVQAYTGKVIARKPIKNINFGLIYGMGIGKLTRSLGLSEREGKELFEAYHEAAPFAKATMERFSGQALAYGYVTTILGRRSRFELWEPDDRHYGERRPALPYVAALRAYGDIKRAYSHKALNRVLQGSAADGMKAAMLACWESGVFDVVGVPRLTVHDELDFSDAGGNEEAWEYVKRTLETALPLRVPVIADLEVGPSWGQVA